MPSGTGVTASPLDVPSPARSRTWWGAVASALKGRAVRLKQVRLSRPTAFAVVAAVVTAWALAANLARIGFPSAGFDEPYYAQAAWRYIHGDSNSPPSGIYSNFDNFEHPPLAKYLFGLAQLLAGHPSVVADRVVAALCTLGSAAVLGGWLWQVAGRWVGLGAAALVALLPMSVSGLAFRFGRYGYLDPVAELFAVGSLALAWMWFHRLGRAGWWFAIATGASVGLATAGKENGFLGAVGPVIAGLSLAVYERRVAVERALQAAAAVATSVLVFALTYVGLGHPVSAFRFMLRYQREHEKLGHQVAFAGRVALHPPGWAFLWFAQHGIGTGVTILCLICVSAAVLLRHDLLVLWCLAALAGPLIFHMAIARIVLSFYWVMWMPAFLALVALGLAELAGLGLRRSRQRDVHIAGVLVAAVCATVLTATSAHDTYRMLTLAAPRHRSLTYSAVVLAHSPLVYLRMDEISGTAAADSSGNGRNGSYTNRPTLGATGLLTDDSDSAVAFDGSTQYTAIPGAPWMNVTDYSITVWFSSTQPSRYLASRDNYRAAKVWNLTFDASGHLRFLTFSAGGAGQAVATTRVYTDGQRHMAVCVKFGASLFLYVDGHLAASAHYNTFARNTGSLGIDLARRGNAIGYFRGTLDEFALYAKALSPVDVASLYDTGALPASTTP